MEGHGSKRLMKAGEILAFVDQVIKAGCDNCAIGHDKYVLGDIAEMDAAADELERINEVFSGRDFLKLENCRISPIPRPGSGPWLAGDALDGK